MPVSASTETRTHSPSVAPAVLITLSREMASDTSVAVTPSAAMRTGSSHTRMAR